ncbi:MAG: phage portal protein family protein [Mongoliitalea sp.]
MQKNRHLTSKKQASKNPSGAAPSVTVTKIDVRPWHRREQDIPSWRTAHKHAEGLIPRRTLLYDLYADVELDGHVEAVTGKRRDAVTSASWQYVDADNKPVDAINELIQCIGFNDLLEDIVNSRFWGYSIFEPSFFRNWEGKWEMDANLIPRLNYRPELGIIAYDHLTEDGINVREGYYAKTIMEVGRPEDLGLHLKAAPYAILKRGGLGDYALFVQVFGNPLVDAEWDGFDEQQRLKLLEAINALGSGGALVRPAGTKVTLLENKSNATGDLQANFISLLNREMSKTYLGSTETTEASSSSGYAQSKTHADQDERKMESDLDFVKRVLNSRFRRILSAHGFPVDKGSFIIVGEDNELTKKESYDIHRSLAQDIGLPIEDDFWYENYGVPKPANYDKLKEAQNKPEESPTPVEKGKDKPEAKNKPTTAKESETEQLSFAGKIIELVGSFFGLAPADKTGAMEMTDCCGNHHTITLAKEDRNDYSSIINQVWKAKGSVSIYPSFVESNIRILSKGFQTGWMGDQLVKLASIGVEYHTLTPKASVAYELNIFQFSTVKAAYQSNEVNELFRKAKSFQDFKRMVETKFGVKNDTWLATEYATAYQVGQLSATYYRLLEQANTFPYWMYKTIGDDRVRDSHRLLHDAVFPVYSSPGVLNPVWKKIFPPNGWGCRCYIVPRMANDVTADQVETSMAKYELFLQSDEWVKAAKSGFGYNKADTQEVFKRSQFYSQNPDKVLKKAGEMYHDDWGMNGILEEQALKGKDTWENAISRDVIDRFIEDHKVSNRKLLFTDYAGRELEMNKKTVTTHTNPNDENYVDRHQFIQAIPEVLRNPDEVWINDEKGARFDSYVYLKYYNNVILKVVAELDEMGNLEVKTWYPASIENTTDANRKVNDLFRHRRGIPVKK